MDFIKITKCYKLILVALLITIIFACKNAFRSGKIKVEKSKFAYINNNLDDSSAWTFGYHQININDNEIYIGYLKDENNIRFIDTKDSSKILDKSFEGEVLGIYSFLNTFSLVYENKIVKYTFDTSLVIKNIQETKCIKIVTDTLLYFPYLYSGIVPLNQDSILVPYRLAEEEINPIDSLSYLLLVKFDNIWHLKNKIIPYPKEYSKQKEYLILPIASYSKSTNSLFYTHQKKSKLYKYNFQNGTLDSSATFHLETKEFNGSQCSNVGYIRKYIFENDCISKIFCTSNYIYVLIKRKKDANAFQKLLVFNTDLKQIGSLDIKDNLLSDYSFALNDKIYVKNPNNYYSIFSYYNN